MRMLLNMWPVPIGLFIKAFTLICAKIHAYFNIKIYFFFFIYTYPLFKVPHILDYLFYTKFY